MAQLTLIRHGQSLWNAENRFTGWVDVPLSRKGVDEALAAGDALQQVSFDVAFSSDLARARQTLMLLLSENKASHSPIVMHDKEGGEKFQHMDPAVKEQILPVYYDWRLNERYYGDLQGKNKDAMREEFGAEQIKIWRRSFDISPPGGESLKQTCERTLPCFNERIIPLLKEGKNVLVSAHGNSLRSIIMHIESISEEDIVSLEIATGNPIRYEFVDGEFKSI